MRETADGCGRPLSLFLGTTCPLFAPECRFGSAGGLTAFLPAFPPYIPVESTDIVCYNRVSLCTLSEGSEQFA